MGFQVDMSPLVSGYGRLGQGLGQIGQGLAIRDEKNEQAQLATQQQEQQNQLRGLMQAAAQGDQQAIEQLYALNPDVAKQFEDRVLGQQSRQQEADDRFKGERAMATAGIVEQMYRAKSDEERQAIFDAAVDDDRYDIDEEDRGSFNDQQRQKDIITRVNLANNPNAKEYLDRFFGGDKEFKQGTGEMSGYSFDPETGAYSISDQLKQKMEALKEAPTLDVGDRKDIQKDITSLTKDTKLIRNTAADLDKLGKVRSGPAAIAMIFKFMKALDPTSVVRESEFATAESAAGMPETIKNTFDKVWAGERLGDEQMKQFISTAKSLANSAIDSSSAEITSFLDTFEGTIPKTFIDLTMKRIPKRFAVEEKATATPEQQGGAEITEADIYARYGVVQ